MPDGGTRQTIRAVALELFSTKGYEQTSLREIADRVGLTKASLYYHFPSKQDLLIAIAEPLVTGIREVVAEAERTDHTPANVRLVLDRYLTVVMAQRAVAEIFLRDPAGLFAAAKALWDDMLTHGERLISWLAGPGATPADRLRAAAAMDVLRTAMASTLYVTDISDAQMREVLLDSAGAVLRLRRR